MKKILAAGLLCLLGCTPVLAQDTAGNSPRGSAYPAADKIVAIVGDQIILQSDIQGDLEQLTQGSSTPLPANAPCAILEQIMAQKALVIQAERDSLPVTDDDVEGALENQIRGFINMYGSQQKLEQVAGMSMYQLREKFREPIREKLLANAERKKIIDEVKITPSEVQQYFSAIPRDSLQFYPSEVQVGQIVVNPKASPQVDNYTLDQLNRFHSDIVTGKNTFVTLMTLYSQDPGSKQGDGTFQITRGDKNIDPDFLAAAFRLKDGEVSFPVKSKFGYHLIQMVHRAGDNATVRDLLMIPDITSEDIAASLQKLDTIRSKIIAGTRNFGQEANKYSDDPNAKLFAGMLTRQDGSTYLTMKQLDPSMVLTVDSLKPGQISEPAVYDDPNTGKRSTRIIYLESRTKPHVENMQDDYNRIMNAALQEKQYQVLNQWFTDKMPTFYIMVDKDFSPCTKVEQWAHESAVANSGK